MTNTFFQGIDGTIRFPQFLEYVISGLTSSTATSTTSTYFSLQTSFGSLTLNGTGFTYTTIGGQTYLTGGTIGSIEARHFNSYPLGTATNLTLSAAVLSDALLNETFGFDPLAVENVLLSDDWSFVGSARADILTEADISPDGVEYAPSGDDIADLGDGDDRFYTGAGNDTIYGGGDNDSLSGGDGNDELYGGDGKDSVYGGAGNDDLYGGSKGGTDLLFGGDGQDNIYGGNQRDILHGDGDNDVLYGGIGNDDLFGDDGKDLLFGEAGDDKLYGGAKGGTDSLFGGSGNDQLYGGNQRDKLWGGSDDDLLFGGIGNDDLYGGNGNDTLYGDRGREKLFGGDGDDTFFGGTDNDQMWGGTGADQFEFDPSSGADVIWDYDYTEDSLHVADTTFVSYGIFTDKVVVSHTGGSVTLDGVTIDSVAEYNAFLSSVTIDFA